MTFIEDSLWVINENRLVYEINPETCIEKKECNKENKCIINSWNITGDNLRGLTYDGEYLYVINRYPGSNPKISKYSLNGEFIEDVITDLNDVMDLVWDGRYFWTIEAYFSVGIPEVPLPPSHFDIRTYNEDWEAIFHQKFEIGTPVFYGISYDGRSLWISDGYNDKVSKISILNK